MIVSSGQQARFDYSHYYYIEHAKSDLNVILVHRNKNDANKQISMLFECSFKHSIALDECCSVIC